MYKANVRAAAMCLIAGLMAAVILSGCQADKAPDPAPESKAQENIETDTKTDGIPQDAAARTGRLVKTANGTILISETDGVLILNDLRKLSDKLYDGLYTGDLIEALTEPVVMETWPGQVGVYTVSLIEEGSISDIDEGTLAMLEESGYEADRAARYEDAGNAGWDFSEARGCMTKEAEEALTEALDGFTGSDIEPIALLGTRTESGAVRYAIACRTAAIVPNAESEIETVIISKDEQNSYKIDEIKPMQIRQIYITMAQDTSDIKLAGDWDLYIPDGGSTLPEEAEDALMATSYWGRRAPLAYLGELEEEYHSVYAAIYTDPLQLVYIVPSNGKDELNIYPLDLTGTGYHVIEKDWFTDSEEEMLDLMQNDGFAQDANDGRFNRMREILRIAPVYSPENGGELLYSVLQNPGIYGLSAYYEEFAVSPVPLTEAPEEYIRSLMCEVFNMTEEEYQAAKDAVLEMDSECFKDGIYRISTQLPPAVPSAQIYAAAKMSDGKWLVEYDRYDITAAIIPDHLDQGWQAILEPQKTGDYIIWTMWENRPPLQP